MDNLLVRTDAKIAIGTGHVMRCLALAQAWQDAGGRVFFAMAETTDAVCDRLRRENIEVLPIQAQSGQKDDAHRAAELAREVRADWIVVDGYQFGSDYQQVLKSSGLKVLFLDDYGHGSPYFADFVLNQNVSARLELYADRKPDTRLLLGTRYCLLRREFSAQRAWKREISPMCHRVLVMMGGSDPENLTARTIEALALARIDALEATVVVGGSNPHFDAVKKAAADSRPMIRVVRDVSNLAELMAEADIAISAAGSTCWELCLLGLPSLLIDVAANQTALAEELHHRGCAVHIGHSDVSSKTIAEELRRLCEDPTRREALSQRSRELVDGKGAARVVSVLRGQGLRLRRVGAEDRRLLWEWANDPEVRAASFSPDPIPWETHVAWFEKELRSGEADQSLLLLAEDDQTPPIGQVRFDRRLNGGWEVDISIAKEMRGCGIGSELISLGVQELQTVIRQQIQSVLVHALVKPANMASVKAFEQAGFKRAGTDHVRGYEAIHLIYELRAHD